MKVDYLVTRKGTKGPVGKAIREYGTPDNVMVEVYWGTVQVGREAQQEIRAHRRRDLDIAVL